MLQLSLPPVPPPHATLSRCTARARARACVRGDPHTSQASAHSAAGVAHHTRGTVEHSCGVQVAHTYGGVITIV
ncbi:hypothetical protein EON67_00675 [archaeon]|nr:MAG: hypothetical protein EON67_00675 [archaeon]